MFAIYKKELRSYFINPIGYIYMGIFLAIAALLFCFSTIISGSYNVSNYFLYMLFAFIILIPLLTMRLFSEERKLRTEQLLLTAPVTITGMVIGKFLSAMTLFASTLVVSCINFIPLYVIAASERAGEDYTAIHLGPVTAEIFGCMIALLLVGAAFIAIGTFISSLTENQLAAAVITIAVMGAMIGIGFLGNVIDAYWLRAILSFISVYARFGNFANGLFDFAAIFYYLSLAFVFLFLTIRVYEKRRWN